MFAYQNICGLETIADEFDLFLIDQFGVLHDGTRPYEGAIECLTKLRSLGKSVVLLSNSGRRSTANADRLMSLGFPVEAFDHVVTSGEVAWQGIVNKTFGEPFVAGRTMFLLGHDDYSYGFEQIGMKIVPDPVVADFIMIAASSAPEIAFDEYRRVLSLPAAAHIPALCCNPDRLMLTPDGLQPSAGEIAALYAELGGEVTYVGKPYSAMYTFACRKTQQAARTIAIGDSIEHDIQGGSVAGLATALVLSGLSAQLNQGQLLEEFLRYRVFPDFVLPGLCWS